MKILKLDISWDGFYDSYFGFSLLDRDDNRHGLKYTWIIFCGPLSFRWVRKKSTSIIYKFNSMITKKKFTHTNSTKSIYYVVARPDDFFSEASKLDYNVFTMQCLQSYVQLDNGKWHKSVCISFKSYLHMVDSGIVEL